MRPACRQRSHRGWAAIYPAADVHAHHVGYSLAVNGHRRADGTARNRARTSDLIVTLRDKFVFAVLCGNPVFGAAEMERIIKTMARAVSPVRPNRSFPRVFRPHLVANANLKSHL